MKKTLILLCMVVALVILPFFINHGGEYGGSDGEAESQIQAIAPHYEPWFQPLYEPASGEIESLLFTPRVAGRSRNFLHSGLHQGQTTP